MRLEDLDYPLPPEAIAQHPIEPRDAARLLVDRDVPRLPVVDAQGNLVGAIGRSEIVRALATLEFE